MVLPTSLLPKGLSFFNKNVNIYFFLEPRLHILLIFYTSRKNLIISVILSVRGGRM